MTRALLSALRACWQWTWRSHGAARQPGRSTPVEPGDIHLLGAHNRQLRNRPHGLVERTTRLPQPLRCKRERDAAASNGGAPLPRRILDDVSTGIRSVAEGWARRLVSRAGLPPPRWNAPIRAPDGALLGVVDAWWDDIAVAWDLDAYQFHQTPGAVAEPRRHAARLTAAGILVVHTAATDLRDDPDRVTAELRRAHRHAARRPRPPVATGAPGG